MCLTWDKQMNIIMTPGFEVWYVYMYLYEHNEIHII